MYTLSLDTQFAPFLVDGATWLKKTKANPLRGFTDDGSSANPRLTAQQKVNMLELMLGQIANYCPVISRNTIVKNSTSVDCMWASIRLHYGFQVTEAHFVDFTDIHSEHGERPENLFQRLIAFMEDNLLRSDNLTHHGERATEDEEMSPSLENFVILTWLRLINPEHPRLVKQRYGTELRSCTLASIKPEISQALPSLLDELQTAYDAKAMRTAASTLRPPPLPQQALSPRHVSALVPTEKSVLCVNKQAVLIVTTSAPVHSSQTLTGSLLQRLGKLLAFSIAKNQVLSMGTHRLSTHCPLSHRLLPRQSVVCEFRSVSHLTWTLSTTTTLSVSLLTAVQPAT